MVVSFFFFFFVFLSCPSGRFMSLTNTSDYTWPTTTTADVTPSVISNGLCLSQTNEDDCLNVLPLTVAMVARSQGAFPVPDANQTMGSICMWDRTAGQCLSWAPLMTNAPWKQSSCAASLNISTCSHRPTCGWCSDVGPSVAGYAPCMYTSVGTQPSTCRGGWSATDPGWGVSSFNPNSARAIFVGMLVGGIVFAGIISVMCGLYVRRLSAAKLKARQAEVRYWEEKEEEEEGRQQQQPSWQTPLRTNPSLRTAEIVGLPQDDPRPTTTAVNMDEL